MAFSRQFNFKGNINKALGDAQLRDNLRYALGSFILKRKAVFHDYAETESLRDRAMAIKKRALSKLPELLYRLEKKCIENGIRVHWAETSDQANKTVFEIMGTHKATRMVKGKSMVSEEMGLNGYLEKHNIEALETDLGEFIIQLNSEKPSHIVAPAIHKSKKQVAAIIHERIPGAPYTEDVEELNNIARTTIRSKFYNAQVGLSGVNFAVAETGTLCLVENEGNGRMCTTVPPVHIAVMGLEKVIERMDDLPPLVRLLTGSATGQLITTYVNMITSPRKPGEKDGPREVHLIILDNGRSNIFSNPDFRVTLHCIRCGTCLNHCPVYTRIGGHAYGFVYPGPIGKILNPQLEGLEKAGELATASSLCMACEEVCPVRIPITDILRRLRNKLKMERPADIDASIDKLSERLAWKTWSTINRFPRLLSLCAKIPNLPGLWVPEKGIVKKWTVCRTKPVFASRSLKEMVKKQGIDNE